MIYRLELENFYSYRDRQVLDLRVPLNSPMEAERMAPIFPGSPEHMPKVVAIFGANGSGKSSLLKALSFLHFFICDSFEHKGVLPCERFNDEKSANRPIKLAIELGGNMELALIARNASADSAQFTFGSYRYELEIATRDGSPSSILREALLQKPNGEGRWRRVMERSGDRKIKGSKQFSLAGYARAGGLLRPDASAISTLAKLNHPESKEILRALSGMFTNIYFDRLEPADNAVFSHLSARPDMLKALNDQLQRIDIGVESARLLETPSGPTLIFSHLGHGGEMLWELESHGTRSFIRIFPFMAGALAGGGIAALDDIDSAIHPSLLPEIIGWFHNREKNPSNAQLWMTCHAVSLLEDLAKEEIVFCEKDQSGGTTAYRLGDIKPARRSDNFYRKYMGGEYGAIPRIG